MRVIFQILVLVAGLAVILGIAYGLQGTFPAFSRAIRGLLHPGVLLTVAALILLLRMGRAGKSNKRPQ